MLQQLADYIVYTLLGLTRGTHLGDALNFFVYDTTKIFLLLSVIIFIVAILRSQFTPERTRKLLSHKAEYVGNILAALLGIVTPFCSCSAVPLFIGFVESGVPPDSASGRSHVPGSSILRLRNLPRSRLPRKTRGFQAPHGS